LFAGTIHIRNSLAALALSVKLKYSLFLAEHNAHARTVAPDVNILPKLLDNYTTYDLTVIASMAALGLATKHVIYPVVSMVSVPVNIPTGTIAGGIYMMWLLVARGVVKRPGAATLCAAVQGFAVFLTAFGKYGVLNFPIYIIPGIMIDGSLLLVRHGDLCCRGCSMLGGMLANAAGVAMVSTVVFHVPLFLLLFQVAVGAVSGAFGGVLAFDIIKSYRKLFPGEHDMCGISGEISIIDKSLTGRQPGA